MHLVLAIILILLLATILACLLFAPLRSAINFRHLVQACMNVFTNVLGLDQSREIDNLL